jgi:hypothetical protein
MVALGHARGIRHSSASHMLTEANSNKRNKQLLVKSDQEEPEVGLTRSDQKWELAVC